MKLISNTSFGIICKSREKEFKTRLEYLDWYEKVRNNLDNFFVESITLGMFIPVDEDNNVLEEPKPIYSFSSFDDCEDLDYNETECETYKKAKENVIFDGFEVYKDNKKEVVLCFKSNGFDCELTYEKSNKLFRLSFSPYYQDHLLTVEELIFLDLTLTNNQIKKLGL